MMPDGRVGHAELEIGAGRLYLAEEFPEIGVVAPRPDQATVSLSLQVPDVAETMRRAIARGGRMPRPMYDDYGSRNVTVVDPFGHRWLLHTPLAQLPDTQRPGDVGYAWLTVPDPDRAAAFYAAVLGWEYSPGYAPGGRTVEDRSLGLGIGPGEPGWHLSYAVDDVAAAVERVRAAGGRATDPDERPWGAAADCADDQGTIFAVHPAGSGPRSPENGARPGDLSYLTLQVVDSARFREFYGSVLGWTFTGGRMEDGWSVAGVSPMTGMHGGNAAAAAVPMWKVDDVSAAVERVRAAGGTATDPERQPYGTTAECTDDQGVRFYLGDA
jgi:predicted enzyme related to lactoylglutathione lyase